MTLLLFGAGMPVGAEAPPKRGFEKSEKAVTLPLNQNLIVSADKLDPATDPATGGLVGLSASGSVLIQVRPKGSESWIKIACGKATYDLARDEVVLSQWPAVKSGMQILRATDAETVVRVARKDGKWEIKGPHKIEISLR